MAAVVFALPAVECDYSVDGVESWLSIRERPYRPDTRANIVTHKADDGWVFAIVSIRIDAVFDEKDRSSHTIRPARKWVLVGSDGEEHDVAGIVEEGGLFRSRVASLGFGRPDEGGVNSRVVPAVFYVPRMARAQLLIRDDQRDQEEYVFDVEMPDPISYPGSENVLSFEVVRVTPVDSFAIDTTSVFRRGCRQVMTPVSGRYFIVSVKVIPAIPAQGRVNGLVVNSWSFGSCAKGGVYAEVLGVVNKRGKNCASSSSALHVDEGKWSELVLQLAVVAPAAADSFDLTYLYEPIATVTVLQ